MLLSVIFSAKLVCDAPEAISWLNDLGVEFDKEPDGTMITTHGGGVHRENVCTPLRIIRALKLCVHFVMRF